MLGNPNFHAVDEKHPFNFTVARISLQVFIFCLKSTNILWTNIQAALEGWSIQRTTRTLENGIDIGAYPVNGFGHRILIGTL